MKAFAIVLLLVFKFYNSFQETEDADYQTLFKTSLAACAEENEVDPKIVDKIWSDPDFPADNAELKCFYHCMHVKLGVTDQNENIDDNSLKKLFAHYNKPTEATVVGGDCKNLDVPDGDLCEIAYQLVKCVAEFQLND